MPKKTPLNSVHRGLGAKMIEFGGWEMPVFYTNIIDEHTATRTKAGLFDICHMGEFTVEGKNALKFLERVMTNSISRLKIKQALYTCMCYENGGVIDDLFVYRTGENSYMLVVNASNIEKDFEWLNKNIMDDVKIIDISENTAKIDIQGPLADKILQKLTDSDLSRIERFEYEDGKISGVNVMCSRSGYTGEKGFELFLNTEYAEKLWDNILNAGKDFGLKPVGLGARDTLRIEACYSLYGHEINENTTPVEAGLGFIVKLDKDFIGKQALQKKKQRELVCFKLKEKGIPREKYDVLKNGKRLGFVTSGTFSPTFKMGLGMALVEDGSVKINDEIEIEIRGRKLKGIVVERPFYKFNG